ncbi:methyltransferase [Exidia glandulosa HHB12029]|uniref:tRNA N(3)-methylcytidine methyltransferase n=1 Tax=Exidia glandulosa HHB12029 TaxID=1314781 RepID=A0A165F1R5_EXIGL|nr:methyltransferase [Exidia glandulosa HHB12029]
MDPVDIDDFEEVAQVVPSDEPEPPKKTSSVQNRDEDAPFGSRYLVNEDDVFTKNAWDHVPAPEGYDDFVNAALDRQKQNPVSDFEKTKVCGPGMAARHWDIFYKNNQANFFRDRRWLNIEFPELVAVSQEDAPPARVLEVGCGAGNTVLPVLAGNLNPHLALYACDFSPRAVSLVQSHELYTSPPAGTIFASVWDLTSDALPEDIEPGSIDIIVLIFVMSALQPSEWVQAVRNMHTLLRPGGRVLFRDYGRHDLAQLRFKAGRLLEDNFYIRGDRTRVYFFELEELEKIFGAPHPDTGVPLFAVDKLGVDRRLLVNRKRQLKMYRVWMQGKFVKPHTSAE